VVKKVFIRSAYNYDYKKASDDAAIDFDGEESRTIQSAKDECDINVIVKRFGVTGVVPANVRPAMYGDFLGISDYRSALDAVRLANEDFMQLSSDVRDRFHNDPQEFLEFCSKSENLAEMRKMGLAVPEVPPVEPVITPKTTVEG